MTAWLLGWTSLPGSAEATFGERVWLVDEMKDQHPPYAAWLRTGKKEVR
jgi:hypothetical protein